MRIVPDMVQAIQNDGRVTFTKVQDVPSSECEGGSEAMGKFFRRSRRGRPCRWVIVFSRTRTGNV